ncbi:hypothetical protein B566_EDAN016051 [Ephemera danica]|nr:hypothetical protein B566_EDAN016051 [Ephemera danica]
MVQISIQFHLPRNESTGNLEDSRNSQLLYGQHPRLSLQVQLPRCSDLWPSCFQRRSDQTRSCQVGKSDRKDRNGWSPWCLAPDQRGWREEHISCRVLSVDLRLMVKVALRSDTTV